MTRQHANTYIALAIAFLLVMSLGLFGYGQAKQNGQQNINELTNKIAQDINQSIKAIRDTVEDSKHISSTCDEGSIEFMRKAVFDNPAMSEVGVVTEQGYLICNSFGVLNPAIQTTPPLKEYQLRYHGPIISDYLGASAFVLAKTRRDHIEVNALIPTNWFHTMLKLPLSTRVNYVAVVDMLTGVPVFKQGHYSLPLEHRLFPIEQAEFEFTGKFDDLNYKYLYSVKFAELPSLGIVIAINERDLVTWQLKWLLIASILFALFYILTKKLIGYLELFDRSAKARLLNGLENQEFFNVYQPFIDSTSKQLVGVEVLIRWRHPIEGELGPAFFIPEAERDGSILALSIYQIEQTIKELSELAKSYRQFKVSFNANGYLLLSQKYRQAVLKAASCFPLVTLELTERDVLNETESRHHLADLSAAGIEIAIDDFGTGYSGLQYLQQFPIDLLKIDQSFVASIGKENLQAPVLEAIIDMAKKLNKRLIAEGVETLEQSQYLAEHGVTTHQGWYYSKALPSKEFIRFIENNTV